MAVSRERDEITLCWLDAASFRLVAGREIWLERAPDLEPALLRALLLGPVLAALLHQRGHLVLYASAVSRERRAVLLLGDKGTGKSTLTFADALDLIAAVPVHALETPDDLAALHGLPAFIEEDLNAARPAR